MKEEVIKMTSFKNTIINSIKRKQKTREEYETVIATWMLHNWLTEDEAIEVFIILDEFYPIETPVV